MSVTMEDVRAALAPEEPNYSAAAKLGPEALPHLARLAAEAEPGLAAKATYLASLIDSPRSAEVLRIAAQSPQVTVRVAAAAALRNLPGDRGGELVTLLAQDGDGGVRKLALRSREVRQRRIRLPAGRPDPVLVRPQNPGGGLGTWIRAILRRLTRRG
jgi:hypothetical protein